jgi:hypothetical protein
MARTKFDRSWYTAGASEIRDLDGLGEAAIMPERAGRPRPFSAQVFRGQQAKPACYFGFKTLEEMEAYIETFRNNLRAEKAEKDERLAKKKALRELPNPFKVGDILHSSWGYDQTNCEFYQVVEVKVKSVVVREIGHITVPGSSGHDCCHVTPDRDNFIGEPITKIVQRYQMGDVYLNMGVRGTATLINENQSFYSSWYA